MRAYIYLISFRNSDYIYIGKTTHQNVYTRLKQHKYDKLSAVYSYVKKNLMNDWSHVFIDIIDSVDVFEDLSYFINIINPNLSNNEMVHKKILAIELFHIHNYNNDEKYKLLNKQITNHYDVYQYYDFFIYKKNSKMIWTYKGSLICD